MKASVLLLTLVLLAVPFSFRPSAEAQDGSTGAMLSSFVSTALSIGSGFLSSIAALLSLLVTAPCAIPATCVSFCIIFPVNILSSVMAGMTSIFLGFLASCPMAELTSILDIGRAVPTACVAPLNLCMYAVWWVIFVVINVWLAIGYAFELVFGAVQLIGGFFIGLLAIVGGLIPIVSIIYGIVGAIVWFLWMLIWTLWDIACFALPSGAMSILAGLWASIATTYMPEIAKNYLAIAVSYGLNLAVWGGSFGMMFASMLAGIIFPFTSSWCGGIQGGAQWAFAWAVAIIMMGKVVVTAGVWLVITVFSAIESCLALPAILVDMQKNCCGV